MDKTTIVVIWLNLIYMNLFHCNQAQIHLTEHILESCYGRTVYDYLDPNCTQDEVLYIRDVYTYAKRLDLSCPHEADTTNRNESVCCRYVDANEDCGMRYYSDLLGTHYSNCVGRTSCKVPVAWNDTILNCNQSIYLDKTNYMRQYYHCIESSSIANICNNPTLIGNPLYIWNDGYPATGGTCATNSGCKCTVTSTNNSPIKIDVFDVRLLTDSAGNCLQRLHIQDGSGESEINCDENNQFARNSEYISLSNSIEIRYDDTSSQSGGNFWIYLEATSSGSSLAVTCSKTDAVYDCSSSLPTLSTAATTIAGSNTGTGSVTSSSSGQNNSTGGTTSSGANTVSSGQSTASNALTPARAVSNLSSSDKTGITVGAAIGALLAVAIMIAAGVIYKKWKKSKARVHADEYEEAFGDIETENVAPIRTEQYKSSTIGTYKVQ